MRNEEWLTRRRYFPTLDPGAADEFLAQIIALVETVDEWSEG
jgi:hypothetical protein